ncbi:MAG: hypothetical protein ACFB21_10330 [Opitutales bacterium]
MTVLLLTIFISVLLALGFGAFFWSDQQSRREGGLERDALLPLRDDDQPPPRL